MSVRPGPRVKGVDPDLHYGCHIIPWEHRTFPGGPSATRPGLSPLLPLLSNICSVLTRGVGA
jgi:hypothetical protein